MRSILSALALLLAVALLMPALAQQRSGRKSTGLPPAGAAPKGAGPVVVTLGAKPLPVVISKHSFDSVACLRLTPAESDAVVTDFQFTYGEHKIYEDSAGNPTVMMDLMKEYCTGDRITSNLREFLPAHSKGGDSAWFENIVVKRKDGSLYRAQPLSFAIRR